MPTTVTKTVGSAGGRDYATLTLWEAQNRDLVTADEIEVAECYNDSTFVESVIFDGWTVDATRYYRIEAAAGNEHLLVRGAGVLFSPNDVTDASLLSILSLRDSYTQVTGISIGEVTLTNNTASNFFLGGVGRGNGLVSQQTFWRCFVYDLTGVINSTGNVTLRGVKGESGSPVNCVAMDFAFSGAGSGNGGFTGISNTSGFIGIINLANNTVLGMAVLNTPTEAVGIDYGNQTSGKARNNLSFVPAGAEAFNTDGSASATLDNNTSSDTTATGTGAVTSATDSDYFVDVGSGTEDPKLKAGSPAIDTGVDLSADFTTDAVGTTRPQGAAWDRGAYEMPVPTTTPSALAFGNVEVGQTSDLTFTIENTSNETVVGAATSVAPFSVTSGGSYSLAPGASQVVTVRFAPTAAVASSENATCTGGEDVTVALTGTGTAVPSTNTPSASSSVGAAGFVGYGLMNAFRKAPLVVSKAAPRGPKKATPEDLEKLKYSKKSEAEKIKYRKRFDVPKFPKPGAEELLADLEALRRKKEDGR